MSPRAKTVHTPYGVAVWLPARRADPAACRLPLNVTA